MDIFESVLEFWKIGHPDLIRNKPGFPDEEVTRLNMRLIGEEFDELHAAVHDDDLVETADALADLLYVVAGMAVTHGIPLEEVFAEVHRTNMAKFPGGVAIRRPSDGKIMKPEGWQPPDVESILKKSKRA